MDDLAHQAKKIFLEQTLPQRTVADHRDVHRGTDYNCLENYRDQFEEGTLTLTSSGDMGDRLA
jgi:hypothetical protein